ncbi:hypothetical protein [Actinopolymorpha alba]|uniref:hypothetical protein n=1 Tax=Actinopolymorpha alba TaxID=533267 RepID=UPI000362888A|nr:hypothetical protein [Actinopolymorpha alba]
MRWVTAAAVITCGHDGRVKNKPSQGWVTIGGVPVLVAADPEGRTITACPNAGPTMKPCATTLRVAKGYSTWLTIGTHRIVLDNLDGLTDGTVPGTIHYQVRQSGQAYVGADR